MATPIGLTDFETRSSREYRLTMRQIQIHLEMVLGDPVLHALIVAGGRANYINTFLREFRSIPADRQMGEWLWQLFTQQWMQHMRQSAKAFLNQVEIVRPPTEKEIEDAWVVESASSEEGRQYFGGS